MEDFQMEGILQELIERLKRWVRKVMPAGPRCLKWSADSWSGPTAFDAFDALIAFEVCRAVNFVGDLRDLLLILRLILRAVLVLLC